VAESALRRLPLLILVALAACSGGDTIHVTGTVTSYGDVVLGECNATDGAKVTFRDGDGSVIGTTSTTKATEGEPIGPVCSFIAPFGVDLPKVDFYQWQVGTTEPGAPMSYDELAKKDFRLDLALT
jgi:hypothetical protein